MDPATVIDPYSRRCLGHATSAQHDQELRVVSLRRGQVELAEYVGSDHVKASRRLGLVQSVGRVASALDNAVAASLNITLKTVRLPPHLTTRHGGVRSALGGSADAACHEVVDGVQ